MGEVEFVLKQSVQEESETFSAGNGAVFPGDDSFVDQFLNLQDVDFPENLQITTKDSVFRSPPSIPPTAVAGEEDLASVLTLPEEEPELEWLSQFMEDSFSPTYPTGAGISPENDTSGHFPPVPGIPRSRRTKRQRPGPGPVWPVPSCSATESTTSSSSSSSATSSPWPPTSPSTPLEIQTWVPNPKKKPKNRAGPGSRPGLGRAGSTRTCSHCGSQKTLQWRAGPMGLKTLCNACGVRFKSGRLFPEYRPASSPMFSSAAHSNSHRKVLEMRKKRAVLGLPEPGLESGLTSLG